MYNRWVPAIEFDNVTTTTAATLSSPGSEPFQGWQLGNQSRYSIAAYVPKHREWRSGLVTIVPHIMTQGTSGNVVLYCGIIPLAYGDTITTYPTSGTAYDKVIAASATVYDLTPVKETTYMSNGLWTAPVDDSVVGLQVFIGRNGASGSDTMTGNVIVLGAMIKYIEGEKSIGENYDPIRR